MKIFGIVAFCLALSIAGVQAQNGNNTSTQASPTNTVVPPPTSFHVIDRGPSHRLWQRQVYKSGPNGKIASHFEQYQEIGSGLCYFQAGQWLDSRDLIEPSPSGSIAQKGPCKVIFAGNLNSEGAIDQLTPAPENKRIRTSILGLAYYDAASGKSVLFAQVQDSQGELISSNQVIYRKAFKGADADVRYTYKKGSFEQDVILRGQPPSLASLGLNPDSTEIEVLTEYIDPPDAAIRENTVPQGSLPDEEINWGQMRLGRGKAFDLGEPANTLRPVTVRREYATIQGRHILIEGVSFKRIQSKLSALPLQSSLDRPKPLIASKTRSLPKTPLALSSSQAKPMKMASALPPQAGYVLDYVELNSDQAGFTFAGDTTYYVSATCNFSGVTTFEGGAIVKLNGDGQINIDPAGSINCETDPGRPAIFTSVNDNSIGDKPDDSSGSPALGDISIILNIEAPLVSLHDLRFSYAYIGVYQRPTPATNDLWNCQFFDGDVTDIGYDVGLHNVLIARSAVLDPAVIIDGDWVDVEQVTADGGYSFISPGSSSATVAATNCLVTAQPFLAPGFTAVLATNGAVCLPSPTTPVYQTVGAGSYYLTNGSPYQNIGAPTISPQLLADLANLTTYPPVVFDRVSFSTATNFAPQAVRDNSGTPSIGYHYYPLDYVFGGCNLSASMTFSAGTAVGWFEDYGGDSPDGQPYGFTLNNGGYLEFDGTATQPCTVPLFSMVQEGGNGNWSNYGYDGGFMMNASTPTLQIFAKFTKFTGTPGWGFMGDYGSDYGTAAMADSEIYNEGWGSWSDSYYFTNCLFYRMLSPMWDTSANGSLTLQNCTLFNGGLAMFRYSGGSTAYWTIQDTTFDGTALYTYDEYGANTNYTLFDYNAYNTSNTNNWQNFPYFGYTCTNTLETIGPDDLMIPYGYCWQTSYLGNFYLPPDSYLIGTGSTTADRVGLYEFTTQTNQVENGISQVDIGYHYVAIDPSTSLPYETYTNNEFDYQADPVGSGLPESWVLYWFGDDNETASQLDPSGNTLLTDYLNGLNANPNPIQFSVTITNNYVNSVTINAQVSVLSGMPCYLAILVNSTNFAGATWNSYISSNLTVNLDPTQGWQYVWIGLRAYPSGAEQSWQSEHINLTGPPILSITNPTASIVDEPVIQVYGFSRQPLAGISYSISNALGSVAHLPAEITDQYYDTNTGDFTTNYFECLDIPLTNGPNAITMLATNLAGAVTATNFYFTLDYSSKTNPPSLVITWPQNGTQISSNNFTCQGMISDPTANVTMQLVFTNNNTNLFWGGIYTNVYVALVERSGNFWLENLPINAGTNTYLVTVTDVAGNTTTTNISVMQSSLCMAINPVTPDSQLWQATVNLTGTISDPTYAIWVNGIKGHNNGDGTWHANNVPVNDGGTASFTATAYAPAEQQPDGSYGN